ncbi:MAG: carbohydrate ABC transporter permease [Acidimicrobiales bacterium]
MARSTREATIGRGTATTFVAPALGLIGVFLIVPALWTLYLSLTNLTLTGSNSLNPDVVGLENFRKTVSDAAFWNSVRISVLFVGGSLIGQVAIGFGLAWIFRGWKGVGRRVLEVLAVVAWIIPGSVVAFLWIAFLDGSTGTLNWLLPGALGNDVEWLLDYPVLSIIVFNTWRGAAFSMLLFGAALSAVPPSHLENARVFGASTWQQLRDIVLPAIRGHILTAVLLITLWTFNLFTPYLLTRGGPGSKTEIIPIFIYREALRAGQLGFGAAISAVMLTINLVIALAYLRVIRERRA